MTGPRAWWRARQSRPGSRPLARLAVLVTAVAVLALVSGWVESTPAPPELAGPDFTSTSSAAAADALSGVLGLGDSVMAGTNCDCAGIVPEYATALQGHRTIPVTALNLGSNGATTTDLIHQLGQSDVRLAVARARVIVVMTGANDLGPLRSDWETCAVGCYQPAVQAMEQRLTQILSTIAQLRAGTVGLVLVAGYWNVFTDGDVADADGGPALVAWSRTVTRAANQAICAATLGRQATCVDTYNAFLGSSQSNPTNLLAGDGDHPNARGVGVIVSQLLAATPADVLSASAAGDSTSGLIQSGGA